QGPAKDMLFGLILGAGVMTIIFFILLLTDQITLINDWSTLHFSSYTPAFVVIFILTGFFEEMFFRGYVIQTMKERNNKRWVIYVVSAVVFGLVHITNPNVMSLNGIVGIVNIILVGFLFAYLFEIHIDGGNSLFTGGTFGIEGGLMATIFIVVSFYLTQLYTKKRQKTEGTLFQHL